MANLMTALLTLFFLSTTFAQTPDYCTAGQREFVPFPPVTNENGKSIPFKEVNYNRVHPSGQYMLVTGQDDSVWILDLSQKGADGKILARMIPTPLDNEAFAVEPDWQFIGSPDALTAASYFSFEDLIKNGRQAKPAFKDTTIVQVYQSSGITSRSDQEVQFRSVDMNGRARDFILPVSEDGKLEADKVKLSPVYEICGNLKNEFVNPNLSRNGSEITLFTSPSLTGEQWEDYQKMLKNMVKSNRDMPKFLDAFFSKHGPYGTAFFKIKEDNSCEYSDSLYGLYASKPSFNFPQKGKKGEVTFTLKIELASVKARRGSKGREVKKEDEFIEVAYIFDRDRKRYKMISQPWKESAFYPNFTKEGKILYGTIRNGQHGVVILDPKTIPVYPVELNNPSLDPVARCWESPAQKPSSPPSKKQKTRK